MKDRAIWAGTEDGQGGGCDKIRGSRGVAQPGSASALGAEGRGFESLRPDHHNSFSITNPDGTSGYAPNGNVVGYSDSVNGMWSQMQYDGLNRLISAQATPALVSTGSTNFCWAYDSFGNRTSQILSNQAILGDGTYCSPQSPSTANWTGANTVYTASNRINYDVDAVSGTSQGSPVVYDPLGSGDLATPTVTHKQLIAMPELT